MNGHLNIGGVERSLIDLLKHIDYNEYQVDLILFEGLGDYLDEVPKEVNLIFYDLTNTYGNFFKCVIKNLFRLDFFSIYMRVVFLLEKIFGTKSYSFLKILFKKLGKYDCAIAYRVGMPTEFVAYVVNAKRKIAWWHNGVYDYDKKFTTKIEKTYDKFDYIVSVSNGCKNMILENLNINAEKIKVIPNLIDFETIQKKSEEKFNDNFKQKNYINIVSIGRLSPEKGMINCVFTCKKLIELGYKINWAIIGDGIEYKNIQEEIKKNRLEKNIFLLGNKKNPYPYLKNADIYVHPSYVESMSITILEAMSLCIPVVAFKSIGPSEFIVNRKNGILVNCTVEELFNGIVELIKDKELYKKLSMRDYYILEKYDAKNIINLLNNLIE